MAEGLVAAALAAQAEAEAQAVAIAPGGRAWGLARTRSSVGPEGVSIARTVSGRSGAGGRRGWRRSAASGRGRRRCRGRRPRASPGRASRGCSSRPDRRGPGRPPCRRWPGRPGPARCRPSSSGRQQHAAQVLAQGQAGQPLDDGAGDQEAHALVADRAARRKQQRRAAGAGQELRQGRVAAPQLLVVGGHVGQPRGVVEQAAHGDAPRAPGPPARARASGPARRARACRPRTSAITAAAVIGLVIEASRKTVRVRALAERPQVGGLARPAPAARPPAPGRP